MLSAEPHVVVDGVRCVVPPFPRTIPVPPVQAMRSQLVLQISLRRWFGSTLTVHADLTAPAPKWCDGPAGTPADLAVAFDFPACLATINGMSTWRDVIVTNGSIYGDAQLLLYCSYLLDGWELPPGTGSLLTGVCSAMDDGSEVSRDHATTPPYRRCVAVTSPLTSKPAVACETDTGAWFVTDAADGAQVTNRVDLYLESSPTPDAT